MTTLQILQLVSAASGFIGSILLAAYVLWEGKKWEVVLTWIELKIIAVFLRHPAVEGFVVVKDWILGSSTDLSQATKDLMTRVRTFAGWVAFSFFLFAALSFAYALFFPVIPPFLQMKQVQDAWALCGFLSTISAVFSIFWANHDDGREQKLGKIGAVLLVASFGTNAAVVFFG